MSINKFRTSRLSKAIAAFLIINFISQVLFPTMTFALTAGPAAPEFASFEPVSTTNMVNDFTGDFTYNLPVLNIPGTEGGGYSMSLSYHSGTSSEQEASWVGLGWTLNPGAINRGKRGYADDFNGVEVIKYNKTRPNWTNRASVDVTTEIFSFDKKKEKGGEDQSSVVNDILSKISKLGDKFSKLASVQRSKPRKNPEEAKEEEPDNTLFTLGFSLNTTVRYNNYSGFSIMSGIGINAGGMASLNMNRGGGQTSLAYSINPREIAKVAKKNRDLNREGLNKKADPTKKADDPTKTEGKAKWEKIEKSQRRSMTGGLRQSFSSRMFNVPGLPYSLDYSRGKAYNMGMSLTINSGIPIGLQIGVGGGYNSQINYPMIESTAYGYLYNPNYVKYKNLKNFIGEPKNLETLRNDGINPIEADFQIEKPTTYNKHDLRLGIPFNNADMFSASGSAVSGGFRIHHNKIGHFFPNFTKNDQEIVNINAELGIISSFQLGVTAGAGFQKTFVSDWGNVDAKTEDNKSIVDFSSADEAFMHFNNDLGGALRYTDNNSYEYAHIKGLTVDYEESNLDFRLDESKMGQSAYSDFNRYDNGNIPSSEVFDQRSIDLYDLNDKTELDGQIAQLNIVDQTGASMIYGLPVYTKNERQLSVAYSEDRTTLKQDPGQNELIVSQILNIDKDKAITENLSVTGQLIEKPYANTYLLTEKRNNNYVDVNQNGYVDNDDIGGWTRFDYRKVWGEDRDNSEWYKYRVPYAGMNYERGRLHDLYDQTCSMSSGEKEVFYLKQIETKSHIAFFVTNKTNSSDFTEFLTEQGLEDQSNLIHKELNGSAENRSDGLSANEDIIGDGFEKAASDLNASGTKQLERLEKIVLFAKNDLEKPLTTTYFEYDYSLCVGIPNSTSSTKGKLTLKKVWSESGGVKRAKIAPYQFEYEYFKNYPKAVTDKYGENINPSEDLLENPRYQEEDIDAWGYYRENGIDHVRYNRSGVNQQPSNTFDPAAWHLKQVKLPSGGEIHIQYEQKDYVYVQDRRAMQMISLLPETVNGFKSHDGVVKEDDQKHGNAYYINLNDLGISGDEIGEYKNYLKTRFVDGKELLYYKINYRMTEGEAYSINSSTAKNLENMLEVTGYCSVNDVVENEGEIYMVLGNLKKQKNNRGKRDGVLPRNVCQVKMLTQGHKGMGIGSLYNEHVKDEKVFKRAYEMEASDSPSDADYVENVDKINLSDFKKYGYAFTGVWDLLSDALEGRIKTKTIKNACASMKEDESYFKLPLPAGKAKKGGGVRVKRILSYSPGIKGELVDEEGNNTDAMVYGREYYYEMKDGTSSGVAVNEPQQMREENAIVRNLPRKNQGVFDKLLNGRDSKIFEGPVGESLMPGASIAHRRVIVQNIHTDPKSSTGYSVNEYLTVYEHPSLKSDYTALGKDIKDGGDKRKMKSRMNFSIGFGPISYSLNRVALTQGYSFVLNDFHGKPSRKTVHSGTYNSPRSLGFVSDESNENITNSTKDENLVSEVAYYYSSSGEEVDVLNYDASKEKKFSLSKKELGTEEDLNMFSAKTVDEMSNITVELDLNITGPTITLGIAPSFTYSRTTFAQHVTSKVVREVSFLEKTVTTQNGRVNVQRNLAYNDKSGDPVLTATNDGYIRKGEIYKDESNLGRAWYYDLDIPAHLVYDYFDQRYNSSEASNMISTSAGNVKTYGVSPLVNDHFTNVLSASVVIYEDNNYDYLSDDQNVTKLALNKRLLPSQTYVLRTDVKSANQSKIQSGGYTKENVSAFDWKSETHPDIWFPSSKVTNYHTSGAPLEQLNGIGIYSSALLGYYDQLPVMTAVNAKREQIYFYDFEYDLSNSFESDYISSEYAHSGSKSFELSRDPNTQVVYNVKWSGYNEVVQDNMDSDYDKSNDGLLMLWLKSVLSENPNDPNYGKQNNDANLKALVNSVSYPMEKVAQTGEWSLFKVRIPESTLNEDTKVKLMYDFKTNERVFLDDIRFQPFDAEATCSVYRNDYKVLAQFDSQHFGMFYEYDHENNLVRKSIETERGKKTVQEQYSNTPRINR